MREDRRLDNKDSSDRVKQVVVRVIGDSDDVVKGQMRDYFESLRPINEAIDEARNKGSQRDTDETD